MIRKSILVLALSFILASCGGGDEPFFPGTWNGTLTLESNSCRFITPTSNLNALFPVTVDDNNDGSFDVSAANGNTGIGDVQGNILVVSAPIFGNDALANYDDQYYCRSTAVFQFLNTSGDSANVSQTFTLTNCAIVEDAQDQASCKVEYTGTATRQ